jgi:two-component system NtrC family sensor kinase
VGEDPVLRRALTGQTSHGVVLLGAERLELEGGPALRSALAIPPSLRNGATYADEALFWWAAVPLFGPDGAVRGLVYGGRALNMDHAVVDELRDLVFGTASHGGKPMGTITIFLRDMRIATNVLQHDRRRAVGTVVSSEVKRSVLELGQRWNDRALVVDAWYLSAYEPLLDPDGAPIGMLYAGLLEAPYTDSYKRFAYRLVASILAGAVVAVLLGAWLVARITNPLRQLSDATQLLAAGESDIGVDKIDSYTEVSHLASSFRRMQVEIRQRERSLHDKNAELAQINTQLDRANKNYMSTLGFVTHELKSPLAAMQGLIDILLGGTVVAMEPPAAAILDRVKRNCVELQDMVKNYLDLARAEHGELVATMAVVELRQSVIVPVVEQAQPLFASRRIQLAVECPDQITLVADDELLRIAVGNFLSNAAKYGREESHARLTVGRTGAELKITVWNEGDGFAAEEGANLFRKFGRLKNQVTNGKRGSGLGLYLCKQIAELHGGRVWAHAEPGQWAEFGLILPCGRQSVTDV